MNSNRAIEIQGFYMKLMEMLGEDGQVSPAWYGHYALTALRRAAALLSRERYDEGYACLETAMTYCEKVASFKKETFLTREISISLAVLSMNTVTT